MTPHDASTVLVVGDDPHFQAELRDMLAPRGYRIMPRGSLRQPFENESADGPRCLVIDLEMGAAIQSSRTTSNSIPAVFVTERRQLSACVQAMKTGAVDVLERPFAGESLFAAVDEAIAMDRAARARQQEMANLQDRYASLTPRERQVLPLITSGLLNKQTAAELGTAEITIRVHRGQIMRKMTARSLPELVRMVDKLGFQTPTRQILHYSPAA